MHLTWFLSIFAFGDWYWRQESLISRCHQHDFRTVFWENTFRSFQLLPWHVPSKVLTCNLTKMSLATTSAESSIKSRTWSQSALPTKVQSKRNTDVTFNVPMVTQTSGLSDQSRYVITSGDSDHQGHGGHTLINIISVQSQERQLWQESKIRSKQANWIQMETKPNQGIIRSLEK